MNSGQNYNPFLQRFSAWSCQLARSLLTPALLAVSSAPALALTLSVTSAGDVIPIPAGTHPCSSVPASCTLRAAIAEANNFTGPHAITFTVPTVTLANGGGLAIQAPVTITGTPVTRTVINGNAKACFSLTDASSVLNPKGANGSTIANLVIQNCNGDAISANGHGFTFINNFIGTNQLGVSAAANSGHGISVSSSRVYPILDFNSIPNISNALTTLNSGLPALPLGTQADISNFSSQLVTALTTLTDPVKIINNVISGNGNNGIEIFSQNLAATIVTGNMIGTDLTGNLAIANGKSGIRLLGSTFANLIGPGNTISGNTEHGIRVESGSVYLPNFIMGNRIGLPTTTGQHIGNGMSGISTDTKPDTAPTSFNPSMISLIIGPGNVIADNKGTTSSSDLDVVNAEVDAGIVISGASNSVKVIGNTIGLAEFPTGTPSASTSYGNAGSGILVTISGNSIGGSSAASGNIIAGNARHGILAKGSSNTGTQIVGNSIGVHPAFTGNVSLGNVGDGVHVDDTNATVVGGPGAADFNTIAANGRHGIALRGGGLNDGWGNLFQRNVIFHNAGLGIDLDHPRNAVDDSQHGPTPASYGNLDQNQPVICTSAVGTCVGFAPPSFSGGNVQFDWTLVTNASSTYRLEFFKLDSSATITATSMSFIGEQTVTTSALNGLNGCVAGRCSTSLAASVLGSNVVMTATDITPIIINAGNPSWLPILKCVALNNCVNNNTSEFSNVAPITASSNASLSALAVASGSLLPAFASGTFVYADAVANAVTSITVTPTVADATATAKVNGNTVASGSASGAIALAVGANAITIVVTAQDGTTTQTYTVNVTRAAPPLSNNASLSALTVSAGSLLPVFASGTFVYANAVANAVSSITVTPTVADATATVKVNGNTVVSGSASGPIALAVGANALTVIVTAQDGTTTQTYTVNVTRAAPPLSSNANLSALAVSSGSLLPVFASGTLVYADAVANAVASITVTPTVADATATVKANGTTVASGSASGAIALAVGANAITVVVTAQDGTTTQTYTVNVNRAGALSNNASLSALAVSSGSLVPVFASGTLVYADAVANAVTSITVTPTVADATATVKVNGTTVASGSASGAMALAVGTNPISVVVTAQDGTTTQTYTVNVNRAAAASNNANLSALAVSSGSLVPAFASATLVYTDAVANGVSSITVTPTVADATATVKVNGTAVASGSASAAIALAVGGNAITVVVTAQDGTTTQTYTVNVNRAGALSNNANLSALAVSSGSLVPVFASATLIYVDAVANAVSSITVTPTAAQANATIKVNGNTVASGSASAALALAVGANAISVVVTAQDGTTTLTYTVNVTRAAAISSNASLSSLVVSGGTLAPAFAPATLVYSNAVANAVTTITMTPTVADATATVKVNGVAMASGSASAAIALAVGANTVTIVVTAQDGTTTQTYTVNVTRAAPVVTVFSGTTFTGTGAATATLSGGGATCTFGTTAFVGPSVAAPVGVTFPDGLFDFTTTNCTGTITVAVTFPNAFAAGAQYWKYGPTPSLNAPHWYTLAAGAPNNLVLSGNTATFTITDGGLGDDDLTVNGTIVDRGGIGIAAAVAATDPVIVPTLSLWSLLLLSGLMLLGFVGVTRVGRYSAALRS